MLAGCSIVSGPKTVESHHVLSMHMLLYRTQGEDTYLERDALWCRDVDFVFVIWSVNCNSIAVCVYTIFMYM